MDMTPRLRLPYIAPQQAQKQVTYNEAMRALDMLVQPVVKSRSVPAPPGNPAEGDVYLVAAPATGGWSGKVGKIAAYVDGAWTFHSPLDGWLLYIEDEDAFVQRKLGTWSPLLGSLTDLAGYQEGAWTPGITFGGAAVGVTYGASNGGRFTRVGRLCVATFLLQLSSKGSSTGAAQITGLPFAAIASPVLASLAVGWAASIAGVSGTLQGSLANGGTGVTLYASSGGASSPLSSSNFTNSSQIQGVLVYDAA